jgi:GTP-binding protein
VENGQRVLVAKGGIGGLGNPHFVTPTMPGTLSYLGPGISSKGEPGEALEIELELKTLADAGLVGLPNAGKSTLLKALSNAKPKIASYAFTTLNPYVGTIQYVDYHHVTIADMPGIIEGAHLNKGLGLKFLRHIERNKVFVYVLDLSGDPVNDLKTLQNEMEEYKQGLTSTMSVIAGNKADLPGTQDKLKLLQEATSLPIIQVSAQDGLNLELLKDKIREMLENNV